MQYLARLSLRKYNSATFCFPSASQDTVNAILCWAGPSKTKAQMMHARCRFQKHQQTTYIQCFARWSLRNQQQKCILCWAGRWKHTAHAMFCSAGPSKTQQCHTYLSSKVSTDSKCYTLLGWAADHIVNAMSCSAELSQTQ